MPPPNCRSLVELLLNETAWLSGELHALGSTLVVNIPACEAIVFLVFSDVSIGGKQSRQRHK